MHRFVRIRVYYALQLYLTILQFHCLLTHTHFLARFSVSLCPAFVLAVACSFSFSARCVVDVTIWHVNVCVCRGNNHSLIVSLSLVMIEINQMSKFTYIYTYNIAQSLYTYVQQLKSVKVT